MFRLKFIEIESEMELIKKYPSINFKEMVNEYPFSVLEVAMKLKFYRIDFQDRKTNISNGNNVIMNCLFKGNGIGLVL